jgi:hypothetical protein
MHFLSLMALIYHRFPPLPLGYTYAEDMHLYSLGFLGLFAVDYVAPEEPLSYTSPDDMHLHSLGFLGLFPVNLGVPKASLGYTSPDDMQMQRLVLVFSIACSVGCLVLLCSIV